MIAKRIILVVILIAFAWIMTVIKDRVPEDVRDFGAPKNMEVDPETGISFAFPRGYVLEETYPGPQDHADLIKTFVLMDEEEYDLLGTLTDTEGPPAITILIFRNEQEKDPRAWMLQPEFAGYIPPQVGEIADISIGALPAISFSADGLYANDNVVVSHGGNLVFMSVAYNEPESQQRKVFRDIVASVLFGESQLQEL